MPETARPSPWVLRFALLVPAGAAVLDLACGSGRHAGLFLERGHPVCAVDRDPARLRELPPAPGLEVVQADLEDGSPWPLGERRFAAVVVTNYLHRPLFPAILAALAPQGLLIYETFARGNEVLGRPTCSDHLLAAGELLEVVEGRLQVVAYEHGRVERPRPAIIQRLCAIAGPAPVALPD
jgi:SAM-dependent methyltransferase